MIVLLGYMGSGKSLVGKKLAEVINGTFADLDQLIEAESSKSIPEIFADQGEIKFRLIESDVLSKTLTENKVVVLALGGGTPCYAGNMDRLLATEGVTTIYLKTALDTLVERLWPQRAQRPLIAHISNREDLKDFIRKHLFDRSPYYMQAQHKVDTTDNNPDEVVAQIVALLF